MLSPNLKGRWHPPIHPARHSFEAVSVCCAVSYAPPAHSPQSAPSISPSSKLQPSAANVRVHSRLPSAPSLPLSVVRGRQRPHGFVMVRGCCPRSSHSSRRRGVPRRQHAGARGNGLARAHTCSAFSHPRADSPPVLMATPNHLLGRSPGAKPSRPSSRAGGKERSGEPGGPAKTPRSPPSLRPVGWSVGIRPGRRSSAATAAD